MKKIFLFLCISLSQFSFGQTTLSLDTCLKWAADFYPLAKQRGYLQEMGDNDKRGINGSWLPQLNMNSRATYQSEVTKFSFPGFSFPDFPKDQYSFGLELKQNIFDGGIAAQQKRTSTVNTETEIQRNEVELYKIKDHIVQLYGNILLIKENLKILLSYTDDLNSRKGKISSAVKNGTVLQSNLDVLDAELLKTEEKLIEANTDLHVLCQTLSLYINKQVNDNSEFVDPSSFKNNSGRPEIKLFSLQEDLLSEKIKLSDRKVLPKLQVFGDGAYGRPGYNFLNQDLRLYGMVGASLTWNISGLYNLSYEKKGLEINKKMIEDQKELFDLNQKAAMTKQDGEINKLELMIAKDKAIVEKRIAISKTFASQLDNGTITSSDYITELNSEKQALLNQRLHEIQLSIEKVNNSLTKGN